MFFMCLGKGIEDSEVFTFNIITLVNIEEVEILRYRIQFNTILLDIFRKFTPPTLNISKAKNVTLLMELLKII